MYRSQQGEWDSSGQAIWSIWQHAMLTHDREILRRLFTSMWRAVKWIDAMRQKENGDTGTAGLMPRGLSAEHLGLADVYYWDAFWSLAGLEAFVRICQILGKPDEEVRTRTLASLLRADLGRSIAQTMSARRLDVIPAGPGRDADAGMIGSIVAWYPLQILPPDDNRIRATVRTIINDWFIQGMFYQPIVHSGLNAYLSLHVAQALLYTGDTEGFWQILKDVSQKASPTYTYPEAIHPLTGGGAMGDGHHFWASAEIALAVRNAFVLERWSMFSQRHTLDLLGGIPEEFFLGERVFGIQNAPIPEGLIDIEVSPNDRRVEIRIDFRPASYVRAGQWYLSLPAVLHDVRVEDNVLKPLDSMAKRRRVPIKAGRQRISCARAEE